MFVACSIHWYQLGGPFKGRYNCRACNILKHCQFAGPGCWPDFYALVTQRKEHESTQGKFIAH